MKQELNVSRNVYLDVDLQGIVRGLQHFNEPVESGASTPQLVAADYLENFADLLGLEAGQLAKLGLSPGAHITGDGVELRFALEKQQEGVATVSYQQTVLSLPIWEAGVTVQIQTAPFRVLSSQSSRHPDVRVEPPKPAAVKRAQSLDEAELAVRLGIADSAQTKAARSKELAIQRRQLVVYQYERDNIFRDRPGEIIERPEAVPFAPTQSPSPTLPLPPVPDSIREGQHYVCVKFDFELNSPRHGGRLNWVAIVEVNTLAVVYLRPFVDDVSGLVFSIDPDTTTGGPDPTSTNALLNPVRVSATLQGLDAPVSGTQHLTGDIVTLTDAEGPTIAAPTKPSGTNFDFDARTNDFAAVNAYVHCDEFFRLCEGMGFSRSSYFSATTFPVSVDHRGLASSTDPTGNEINAHCLGNSGGNGIGVTSFAVADTSNTTDPMGIACDYRVVLHELGGHGVLYNHVSSANFGFSHSAGDGIAAILNDPGSQADDRFKTFPWEYANVDRRHDRTPADGWGYNGNIGLHPFSTTYDYKGYENEQILSSANFRIYQSIGGDSSDMATKQFAARVTVYLILKAIGTLTPTSNPSNATGWVTAMQTADQIDWVSENITGGAYSKVIRWAFEKQGLFQSSGQATPNDEAGDPPLVDVYIDDGRGGEYQYQEVFWENTNIWNRTAADGGTAHQDPVIGQTNFAYVKIKNRGTQDASGVVVKGFHANPSAGLSFPNDWLPMTTAQLSAPTVAANNGAEITVGPFSWVPFHLGHECIIMIVSATGDASNVDNIHAGDLIPDWRLVPNDNNIGQRNVAPVVGGGGTSGLTGDFNGLDFELKNPLTKAATMEVKATLPALLLERGWRLEFTNRGRATFPLQPGESRTVVMRLHPGQPFEAADVEEADEKTILVGGRAGGILVGGLSYVLDPSLKQPRRPPHKKHHGTPDECARTAEALVDCLKLPEEVSRVRIRKITVDLEFDDC
jgi:zinc metalloprotease ZmpB